MTDELTSPTPRRRARKSPVDPWTDATDTAQAEPAATATEPTPDTSQAAEAGDGFGDMAELAGSLELDAEPAEAAEEEGGEVVPFERREGGTTWAGVTPELRAERDEVDEDEGDEEAAPTPPKKAKKATVTDYPAPRPYSSRERLCSTTLEIAVELTVEEVNDRARKLAGITKEEDTLREEKSAFLSTWNGKMKELQTERRELSEAVSLGKERQDFAVHIEADYDRGIAEYVCQSTGRVLETRQLTSDEAAAGRQRRLPLH